MLSGLKFYCNLAVTTVTSNYNLDDDDDDDNVQGRSLRYNKTND